MLLRGQIRLEQRLFSLALAALMLVSLAACAGEPAVPTSNSTTPTTSATMPTSSGPKPTRGAAQMAAGSEQLVNLTRENLVQKLAVNPSDIEFLGSSPQEWPDSALGCPQQGMSYLQVITPGFIIRHQAAGKVYEYHTDTKGSYVLCEGGL